MTVPIDWRREGDVTAAYIDGGSDGPLRAGAVREEGSTWRWEWGRRGSPSWAFVEGDAPSEEAARDHVRWWIEEGSLR